MMIIERQCESCVGTGLYKGFAEGEGAAVICHTCNGTGKETVKLKNTPFTGRKERKGIKRVFQTNPGIGIGEGEGHEHNLEDFGGMPYKEWALGLSFPKKSEMRKFSCPAWWYQGIDYEKKPSWKACIICGSFSSCSSFKNKEKCWEKWDKENKQ